MLDEDASMWCLWSYEDDKQYCMRMAGVGGKIGASQFPEDFLAPMEQEACISQPLSHSHTHTHIYICTHTHTRMETRGKGMGEGVGWRKRRRRRRGWGHWRSCSIWSCLPRSKVNVSVTEVSVCRQREHALALTGGTRGHSSVNGWIRGGCALINGSSSSSSRERNMWKPLNLSV